MPPANTNQIWKIIILTPGDNSVQLYDNEISYTNRLQLASLKVPWKSAGNSDFDKNHKIDKYFKNRKRNNVASKLMLRHKITF